MKTSTMLLLYSVPPSNNQPSLHCSLLQESVVAVGSGIGSVNTSVTVTSVSEAIGSRIGAVGGVAETVAGDGDSVAETVTSNGNADVGGRRHADEGDDDSEDLKHPDELIQSKDTSDRSSDYNVSKDSYKGALHGDGFEMSELVSCDESDRWSASIYTRRVRRLPSATPSEPFLALVTDRGRRTARISNTISSSSCSCLL